MCFKKLKTCLHYRKKYYRVFLWDTVVLHREQLSDYQQVLVKDVSPCSLKFCAQILKIQFSLFKDINMNSRSEYVEGKVC